MEKGESEPTSLSGNLDTDHNQWNLNNGQFLSFYCYFTSFALKLKISFCHCATPESQVDRFFIPAVQLFHHLERFRSHTTLATCQRLRFQDIFSTFYLFIYCICTYCPVLLLSWLFISDVSCLMLQQCKFGHFGMNKRIFKFCFVLLFWSIISHVPTWGLHQRWGNKEVKDLAQQTLDCVCLGKRWCCHLTFTKQILTKLLPQIWARAFPKSGTDTVYLYNPGQREASQASYIHKQYLNT